MTTYKKRDEGLLWHSSKQDKKEPGMETNKDTRITGCTFVSSAQVIWRRNAKMGIRCFLTWVKRMPRPLVVRKH